MAKYEGTWQVLRYWFPGHRIYLNGRRETTQLFSRHRGMTDYFADHYVGMHFPEALYPSAPFLPSKRKEIDIWP